MLSSNVNGFKRVLVMLLCFCLVFTTVPVNFGYAETGGEGTEGTEVTNIFEGGSGTESDPYLIATKTQLDKVRENLSAHYQLTTNITFEESDFAEGGAFYNEGKGWLPIGSGSEAFTGSFDGSGFTIKNLYINSTENNVGLFACNEGNISNLGIVVASINTTATGEAKSGAVAGVNNGTIEKCYATGSLTASTTGENNYAGLIAGSNTETIKNAYTIGNVETATATSVLAAGGVVGFNEGGLVENTYSLAICTTNDSSYAYKGAVAGYNLGGTMTNCYYVAEGQSAGKYATETKSSDPLSESGYAGFDFSTTWKIDNTNEYILPMLTDVDMEYENYSSGSVSISGGNSIGNTLEAVLSEDTDEVTVVYVWTSEGNFVHVGKNFAVGSDMAAKTLTVTAYGFNVAKSWTNSSDITIRGVAAKPDAPIVSSVTKNMVVLEEVEGLEYSKDGQNWQDSRTFTNLERNTNYTFYQRVKETADYDASEKSDGTTAKTIIAETPEAPIVVATTNSSVELTPNDTYEYSIGGQIWQDSNIFEGLSPNTKYTFYQRVKETSVCGYSETSEGTAVTTLKNSIEKPESPTLNYKSDVVVALNEVEGCEYSIDGINWQASAVFEGLSAFTQYTFYQRYFENDTTYVSEASEGFTVRTKTSAPDPVEPVLEKATETSITLVAVEGYEYSIDEGKTWQSSNIFNGLDPASIYSVVQRFAEDPFTVASKNSEVITVKTLSSTTVPEGYIGVYTKADLDAVRNNLDGKYILMNDIVFTEEDFNIGGDFYNGGKGWEPIGSVYNKFNGVFNGNEHKIVGLVIASSAEYVGLFGGTKGTLKNLGMEGGKITATSSWASVGGIVGTAYKSSVVNCYNTGSVNVLSDYACAGGIVGKVTGGNIISCYNLGRIKAFTTSSYSRAGGIVGLVSEKGTIVSCHNEGEIISESSESHAYAGGIVGEVEWYDFEGEIKNCYNLGDVNAILNNESASAGGIVAYLGSKMIIENCYNTGTISGEDVGGIVGENFEECTIKSCYNIGSINANTGGGIIGLTFEEGTIKSCYNTGTISAREWSGGIVGYVDAGVIELCYNEGYVNGTNSGGIAGSNKEGTITSCYNIGKVCAITLDPEQLPYAGGIAASSYNASILNCYNAGTVSASGGFIDYSGGIIGSAENGNIKYCYNIGGINGSRDGEIVGDTVNTRINSCYCLKGADYKRNNGIRLLEVDELYNEESFTGFDFNNVWSIDDESKYPYPHLAELPLPKVVENTTEFNGGSGYLFDPYIITTKEHLNNIRKYKGASFELANDIEFVEEDFLAGGDFYNEGKGWIPIGQYSEKFHGYLDGNGYKIIGLKIDSIETDIGLFGYASGIVKNLGVEKSDITVSAQSSHVYVGSIVGKVVGGGLIKNCYATGNINLTSNSTCDTFVGGIAGDVRDESIIEKCYNTGSVSTTIDSNNSYTYIGGITGYTDSSIVRECHTTGTVSALSSSEDSLYAGGIAGYISGSISNCYNTGSVSASGTSSYARAGGIAGDTSGSISNCYNTGSVSASSTSYYAYAGGIAGDTSGSISNCYYLKGIGSRTYTGTTALSVDQMLDKSFYKGFDFDNVWTIDNSIYYKHPYLKGMDYPSTFNINFLSIEDIDSCEYTGMEIHPIINIKSGSLYLVEGEDFIISCENNLNVGKATITITGIGYYGGAVTKTFDILPATMEVTSAGYSGIYDAESHTITVTAPEDATVTYSSSEDGEYTESAPTLTDAGTMTVYYKVEKDNYVTVQGAETIVIDRCSIDEEDVSIAYISVEYDGTAKEPSVTVEGLTTDDYTVSYSNNVKAGTATVTITGQGNYEGEITKKFTIEPCTHTWDGGTVTTEATCTTTGVKIYTCTVPGCDATKTETIAKADHNYNSSYTVDKKATLSENGSKSKHCSVCDAKTSVTEIPKVSSVKLSSTAYTYNGDKKTPSVTVYDAVGNKLVKDTDYTVKYSSTSRKKIGRYYATVTFKGNYSGSQKLYFTIGPKNPSSVKTTLYGYDDVKVSWSKVSGASGYVVYYKKSGASSYTKLKTTTSTSYKKSNLSDGVKYYFKVVAYKTVSGNKCYNAGKTSSITTLKKVSGVKAAKSSSKVKISWTNIGGETGYQISQSTSKSKTKVVATYKTTSGKSKTISATKGKTYYYKVRAYKVVGDKKIYGPWSSVVKYKR